MRGLWRDLSYGVLLLRSNLGFTAVAVLTLALAIAVNATVFSWIEGVLLRPYRGARDGGELAVIEMSNDAAPNGADQLSYLEYREYRSRLKSISGLLVHRDEIFGFGETATAEPVWGELVSGNYFQVLGVKPVVGRAFAPEEDGDNPGAYPVAVISHRLWMNRFHGDGGIAGTKIRVNRRDLTIVGVAPEEFRGTMPGLAFDIWVPVTMGVDLGMVGESTFTRRNNRNLYALARLRPGVSVPQARAEAGALANSLAGEYPATNRGVHAAVVPPWRVRNGAASLLLEPLRILMAVAVLVLLIACANVANLLLARSVSRQKEFAIRLSLGAGRARIARQLITETLLLAVLATAAALPLTAWMARLLPGLVPHIHANVAVGFHLSARILGFAALACLLATLVSAVAPVLFLFRAGVNEILKEGGRGSGAGAHGHRSRSLLVVSEVALAMVALIGAGLFSQSFQKARSIDPGFDRDNVVLARFYLSGAGYTDEQKQQFCVRLRERFESMPGVTGVTYADYAPLGSGAGPYSTVAVDGYLPRQGESMDINRYAVAPGYFALMRTPVLEGREFAESDDAASTPAIIVNQTFSRKYFGAANPVGRRVMTGGKAATIVGVVQDAKYFSVSEAPRAHFFLPARQRNDRTAQVYFFVRTAGDPASVMRSLRREVIAVDPGATAFHEMLFTDWTEVTLLPQKVAASMLVGLGLVSMLLAAAGLYSVMSYAVTQRTHEIGVRMAMGARPWDVVRDVLVRGLRLTGLGLVVGTAAGLAAAQLIASVLVEVSAEDPLAIGGAAMLLVAVALLASFLPARRATGVDPMIALRCD